jgi:hypothetical protein
MQTLITVDKRHNMKIDADFFRDLARIAAPRLSIKGYKLTGGETPDQLLIKYFNVARRRIARQPRKVFVAPECCCPPTYQAALDEICRKATNGQDLVPYQSRKLADKADYNDDLLNDWDIHHLHLSTMPDPKRSNLMAGSRDVLFVRVIPGAMYCIKIMDHQKWTQFELVKILHQNWPETLRPLKGGIVGESNMTPQELQAFRQNHVNVPLSMDDGTTYCAIGGGYTSNGINTPVRMAVDQLNMTCKRLERESWEALEKQGHQPSAHLILGESGGNLYVCDPARKIKFPLLLPLLPEL